MPNYYETLFIVRPNAEEDVVQGTITAVREQITGAGGEILFESAWGKRKLAYDVADFSEGIYIQVNITAPPAFPPALERVFRLSEDVIRSIVVRTAGPPPDEMPNYLGAPAEAEGESADAAPDGRSESARSPAPPPAPAAAE